MPKVSVIICCLNGEKYLNAAIDSIYAQTCSDWEIVFFDNCSTDKSSEICKKYDQRIKYYRHNVTVPLGYARQLAVNMALGEWVAFLDVDDLWEKNKLEAQLGEVEGNVYSMCYAGVKHITESGMKVKEAYPLYESGDIFSMLLQQFDINMVTPIINRRFLIDHDLNFDERLTASEEYNLFMRIAVKSKICCVKEILGSYRLSSNSLTTKQLALLATERRYTLDQLKKENATIEDRFHVEFGQAYSRGDYYEACHLMTIGKYSEARRLLSIIKGNDMKYSLLYYLTFFPWLWIVVHHPYLKRKLINLFSGN